MYIIQLFSASHVSVQPRNAYAVRVYHSVYGTHSSLGSVIELIALSARGVAMAKY